MGGFGSGRPSGSGRGTVETCRSIEVNRLHREGCLRAGWIGYWQWTRDRKKVAGIDLRAEHDRLNLDYRVRVGGGEWEAEPMPAVIASLSFGAKHERAKPRPRDAALTVSQPLVRRHACLPDRMSGRRSRRCFIRLSRPTRRTECNCAPSRGSSSPRARRPPTMARIVAARTCYLFFATFAARLVRSCQRQKQSCVSLLGAYEHAS
jgi:hypothetical protein